MGELPWPMVGVVSIGPAQALALASSSKAPQQLIQLVLKPMSSAFTSCLASFLLSMELVKPAPMARVLP